MYSYISISALNDFVFCPYSIYLHNVYMGGEDDLTHSPPQVHGKVAHIVIDEKKYSTRKDYVSGMSVFCSELGVAGKIDIYKGNEKLLIERKYQLNTVYQGQLYQLWAQYFCMLEMGYEVERLAFYAIATNQLIPIELPGSDGKKELLDFILKFKQFDPEDDLIINLNKCKHCIYCNLCDKIEIENVY